MGSRSTAVRQAHLVDSSAEPVTPRTLGIDEPFLAAYRTFLALTVIVGGALAISGLTSGVPLLLLVLAPTVLAALGIPALSFLHRFGLRLAIIAAYAAVLVWLSLSTQVVDEALLVPFGMAAAAGYAASKLSEGQASASPDSTPTVDGRADEGWIEENGRVVPPH
jgi:uncharacterized membrane protein YbhN (UPF0104 family)